MIWNFGEVYKIIRKSKGISQTEICADELSRSTLSKIENSKLMPSFQIMDYLLKQINMTFDEFEYICNQYKSSTRYVLIEKISNVLNSYSFANTQELIVECQSYLKVNHDLYIETLLEVLKISEQMQKSSSLDYSLRNSAKAIWEKLAKADEWYFFDLILLNDILFYFPFDIVKKLTEKILKQLSKFTGYRDPRDIQGRLFINLSTIYLYNADFKGCMLVLEEAYPIIKTLNRYDYLAIFWIRSGICRRDKALIEKGRCLLEIVDEKNLLKELEVEIKKFS